MLNDLEANALTDAICDVLDEHKISLGKVVGIWGLYATLITVSFNVYMPRVYALSTGQGQTVEGTATQGPEQKPQDKPKGGTMNFEERTVAEAMKYG